MQLTDDQKQAYLQDHLPYRLNSLRAWDIYFKRRKSTLYENEEQGLKCYWESELLQPALEISIVFGRSLLHFLGIGLIGQQLGYYVGKPDDVQVWDIIKDKQPYPISNLNDTEKNHLINLIRIANKSSAHLTRTLTSDKQFDSLQPAREIIYRITLEHIDGLETKDLWWEKCKSI